MGEQVGHASMAAAWAVTMPIILWTSPEILLGIRWPGDLWRRRFLVRQVHLTREPRWRKIGLMVNTRTLEAFLKARGWSQAELARRVGVSRQAVSQWFRGEAANLQSRHLIRLGEALGVPVEVLARPLPCFEPETRARLRATLLWDRLYPDLDDFAVALNAGDPRALARFVEIYGLFAADAAFGPVVWDEFPNYRRYLPPIRRSELETLWAWHESRKAA